LARKVSIAFAIALAAFRVKPVLFAAPQRATTGVLTWKQAHARAKSLEIALQNITQLASGRAKLLDGIFTDADTVNVPTVPLVPEFAPKPDIFPRGGPAARKKDENGNVKADTIDDFFAGDFTKGWLERPKDTRMRFMDDNPPILSFEAQFKQSVVEKLGKRAEFEMPERMYPAQITCGKDDESLSEEENRLWKESTELLAEGLEQLWPMAEAAMTALTVAEERAETRRPKVITDFRERVVQAMVLAHAGTDTTREELERCLDVLQEEQDMMLKLAKLEELTLEIEGCRSELGIRAREAGSLPKESQEKRRRETQRDVLSERVQYACMNIRAISDSVMTAASTKEVFSSIGETLSGLNPFR